MGVVTISLTTAIGVTGHDINNVSSKEQAVCDAAHQSDWYVICSYWFDYS